MSDRDNSYGPSADLQIQLAEAVYPQLKQEALTKRFGCLGGTALHLIILFLALAVPAKIDLIMFGDNFEGWGRIILALFVFSVLSSLIFTAGAWVLRQESNLGAEANTASDGSPQRSIINELFALDPQLRDLPGDAKIAFVYLCATCKPMRDFVVGRKRFRDKPRPLVVLDDLFKGPAAPQREQEAAQALAAAHLVSLDKDSVTICAHGARKYEKFYTEFVRRSAAKVPGNPPS
jgi:hypothetical protein